MSDFPNDSQLDAQLRGVNVPDDLHSRLRGIASLSDEELDFRVRDVEPPDHWNARLKRIVADAALDERIRQVSIGPRVLPKVHRIPYERSKWRIGQLALAASLLMILSAGYLAALGGVLSAIRPVAKPNVQLVVIDSGPLRLESPPVEPLRMLVETPAAMSRPKVVPSVVRSTPPELLFVDRLSPGPAGRLAYEMKHLWNPWDNLLLARWGILGSSENANDQLPDLRTIPQTVARGMEAPLLRGFDREFLFSRGVHPPVPTTVDASLNKVMPRLTTDDESFERTCRTLRDGRLPATRDIHVEDFLAAMDYRLAPAPANGLAIRTAAGPSVFNPSSAGLLQVGVKAGPSGQQHPATHLTVALDISASMQWDRRLERSRQAIQRLTRYMHEGDSLSLVVFNDEAATVASQVSTADTFEFVAALDALTAYGGTNLNAALRLAIEESMIGGSPECSRRKMVVITDHSDTITPAESRSLRGMTTALTDIGVQLDYIDMSGQADVDPVLSELAELTGGTAIPLSNQVDLRWTLVESLLDQSPLIATDARLEIAFDPKTVAAYRLIGHEATEVGGLMPASVPTDLYIEEEATVLFEVWLYPNSEDTVARVSVEWFDPRGNRTRRIANQRVSRLQFASSLAGSAVSLQAAAVAAETAEILRQGYNFSLNRPQSFRYRPKPRDLAAVLTAIQQVHPSLADRPRFMRFAAMVDDADMALRNRRVISTKAGERGIVGGRWRESK